MQDVHVPVKLGLRRRVIGDKPSIAPILAKVEEQIEEKKAAAKAVEEMVSNATAAAEAREAAAPFDPFAAAAGAMIEQPLVKQSKKAHPPKPSQIKAAEIAAEVAKEEFVVPEGGIQPANFRGFFDEWIESTKKQWGHDRSKTLGGSEVFGCIRKAWYSRNGAEKDADYKESWGATKRGDVIENEVVVPAMVLAAQNHGFNIDYVGSDQQTLFLPGTEEDVVDPATGEITKVTKPGNMSVTPDGLIHGLPRYWLRNYGIPDLKSSCVMFEIKSIDPRVDLTEEKAIHHGQTQIQMGMVRETTDFRPEYAVILYINASFFDDINVFIVPYSEDKYQTAKARAKIAFEAEDASSLMREGLIDGSCQYCPFQDACLQTTVSGMPAKPKKGKAKDSDPALIADLEPLVVKRRNAALTEKKAKKEVGLLSEEIKEVLRRHGEGRAKSEQFTVSYFMQDGRSGLDTALMEADGIDLSRYQKRGDPFEVMRVAFRDGGDEE